MKYGYWGIRGAGQVGRLLLAYSGLEWEDVQYVDREKWMNEDKVNLGFDFPNLPYIVDGDFRFSESDAIHRYIIKKSGKTDLLGKNIQDKTVVMEVEGVIKDGVGMLIPLFYNPEWQKMLPAAIEKAVAKFQLVQKFVGEKEFMLGYLTILDFKISELSYYIEKISKETYDKYPFLRRAREAVEALPEIKAYYETEKAMKGPFLPPQMAVIKM